jgi:hypothetical protein
LLTNDNFRTKYGIPFPERFDFNRKFISSVVDGIKYFKIRLKDSGEWKNILKNILGIEIYIANDYETNKKPINHIFSLFKKYYKIPINLLESIENDDSLKYYYSDQERNQYLTSWRMKMNNTTVVPFRPDEYAFYSDIALDNQYISEIQMDHYIDLGCLCMGCCRKRGLFLMKLQKGEQINEKINHYEAGSEYIRAKAKKVPVYMKIGNKNIRNIGILKNNFLNTIK